MCPLNVVKEAKTQRQLSQTIERSSHYFVATLRKEENQNMIIGKICEKRDKSKTMREDSLQPFAMTQKGVSIKLILAVGDSKTLQPFVMA